MLKNYMEFLIDEVYDEVKDQYDICKNHDCINDIKATALNNLPPVYFLSNTSEEEKKAFLLNRQTKITVLTKITEAVQLISQEYRE